MILLELVQTLAMENLDMNFVIASKCFACASFSVTLFNNLNIAVFLSISVDRIESDNFKIGNRYDSNEDFIHAVIKVQQGHEESLSNDEAKGIAPHQKCKAR